MAAHPQLPEPTVFGPFEINAAAGELRESGIRIRLSAQPMRILLALLARRGELVTREQLREEVWGGTTYVDFDHGLNTAINKLRRALDDSAEKPRFIETVPGRGYRFVGLLERPDASAIPAIEESIDRSEPTTRRNLRHGWWLAALVACLIVFSVWRWRPTSLRPQAAWKLTRITNDVGLSDTAALSPDGKMVAYSSDRSPEGDRDLYVQQVAGGQPIRLTFDGANNTTPNFSPDGGRIVFRSNRDGGGIYEISSFGGEVRLLAKDGFDPRFSPDGSRVAYWVGGEDIAQSVPGGGWFPPPAASRRESAGISPMRVIPHGLPMVIICSLLATIQPKRMRGPLSTGGSSLPTEKRRSEPALTRSWAALEFKSAIKP